MDTAKGRVIVREAQLAADATLGMFEFAEPLVRFAGTREDLSRREPIVTRLLGHL